MQRAGGEVGAASADLPFVGFDRERQRIAEAVRNRQSLLLLGPPGSGKTRLLRFALDLAQESGVYLQFVPIFHELLVSFAGALGVANPDPRARYTSLHLKGLIWRAVEIAPPIILVDGVHHATMPAYRFFQRVYHTRGVAMLAAARDPTSLGALQRLFWDPRQTIRMAALNDFDAVTLFELAADRYGLRELELPEFRARVLDSARGNPGQIVEMCRLAADPQYVSGRHILFAPLRIDAMPKFLP